MAQVGVEVIGGEEGGGVVGLVLGVFLSGEKKTEKEMGWMWVGGQVGWRRHQGRLCFWGG